MLPLRSKEVATGLVSFTLLIAPFVGGLPEVWRGALLGGLIFGAFSIQPRLRLSPKTILPLFLGALFVLSTLWSVRKADSLVFGLAYLGFFLLPAFELEERPLLYAFLFSALLSALCGVRDFILAGSPTWRTFGPFVNPNMFACFLIPAIVLGGDAMFFGPRPARLLGAMTSLLSLVALGLTGSRGGALGLFVALAAYGASLRKRALPLAAGIGLLAIVALLSPLRYRILGAQIPHSHLFRIALWGSTLDASLQRLWGWGFFAFEDVYPTFAQAGFTRMAHSVYLQLGLETGLIGGVLFLALVGLAAKGLINEKDLSRSGTAGLLGQAAHFLIESALYIPAVGAEFALLYRLSSSEAGRGRTLGVSARIASGVVASLLLLASASGALTSQGKKREGGGDLWSALEAYRRASYIFPLNVEVWERLGVLKRNLRGDEEALMYSRSYLEKALQLRPRSPTLLAKLARTEAALGNLNRAEALLGRACDLDRTSTAARLDRAEILLRLKRLEEAEKVLKEALSMLASPQNMLTAVPEIPNPDGVYIHLGLARIAKEKGEVKEEIFHLKATLRELQSYAKRAALARALHEQGLFERVISDEEERALREAIERRLEELIGGTSP